MNIVYKPMKSNNKPVKASDKLVKLNDKLKKSIDLLSNLVQIQMLIFERFIDEFQSASAVQSIL